MLITMKCTRRGPFGVFPIHRTLDVPDDLAAELVRQKAAVPAKGPADAPTPQPANESQSGVPVKLVRTGTPLPDVGPDEFEQIGLGGKVADLLRAGGLKTVADVQAHPDLTELAGIGVVTAASIQAALEEHRS